MKYCSRCDVLRLINIIIHLHYKYLLCDKSLTRKELDNKEQNIFQRNVTKAHNNASIKELERCLYLENEIFRELAFTHSRFMINEGLILDKYNDIKKIIDKALNNYCVSDQGDCGLKNR